MSTRRRTATALWRLLFIAGVAVAALATWAQEARAELRLAVIDMRRALADTEDGLRMKSRLQELVDTRGTEFDNKEKSVAASKAELERLAKDGKTPEAELRKKYAALEKSALELQAAGAAMRREIAQRENDLMVPILTKLNQLVRGLAAKEGYDVVLNREAAPYFRSDLDVTDRVIQLYNAQTPAADDKDAPKDAPKTAPKTSTPKTSTPKTSAAKDAPKDAPKKDAAKKDAAKKDAAKKDAAKTEAPKPIEANPSPKAATPQ